MWRRASIWADVQVGYRHSPTTALAPVLAVYHTKQTVQQHHCRFAGLGRAGGDANHEGLGGLLLRKALEEAGTAAPDPDLHVGHFGDNGLHVGAPLPDQALDNLEVVLWVDHDGNAARAFAGTVALGRLAGGPAKHGLDPPAAAATAVIAGVCGISPASVEAVDKAGLKSSAQVVCGFCWPISASSAESACTRLACETRRVPSPNDGCGCGGLGCSRVFDNFAKPLADVCGAFCPA
eukprot:CAMPEP_0176332174 /NCGR_PEP_ID=MMETSP0121_2-20121125/76940_1 /TAXON_ID=160619 /ORGANISM="Kryptoperidinium foliaceum, Strain CCMP 1326" /LENGTH=235 /DNA_ID=CAMNT_0017675063 /DNA_START=408 /DNA_END=1112 /DNA_ORIENTATION=-